jgi:hypothetical protein
MSEDGTQARGVIAVCIAILLAGALLGSFIVHPDAVQQGNINLLIGALIGALSTIVGFYFGSSSGAKQLVASQAKILEAATGGTNALGQAQPTGTQTDPVAVVEVKKDDPELVKFRDYVRSLNPKATDEDIQRAWDGMKKKPDVVLP